MSILKKNVIIFTVLLLFASNFNAGSIALDSFAQELTDTMVFDSSSTKNLGRLTDDYIRKAWETKIISGTFLSGYNEIKISGISVWFKSIPKHFILQTSIDGITWEDDKIYEDEKLYNCFYSLDTASNFFRIFCPNDEEGKLAIIEVRIFSEGKLEGDVQVWRDTEENPDIMIFSAHPDDEFVFFSGIIPYYSVELQKKVVVVYMTNQYFFRRNEAYNALWMAGEDAAPIFAPFLDAYSESANAAKRHWGEENTLKYLTALIREYRPNVIITHDIDGEYKHGQHMYTAIAMTEAVLLANDEDYDSESIERFGLWEVKKLYLHLYEENPIVLDWDIPMDAFDGMTAIEVSKLALNEHKSQLHWPVVRVRDKNSSYPSTEYGLAYSIVGLDTIGGDFLENIPIPTPIPTPTPTLSPSPTPTPTPTSTPSPVPSPTPTLKPTEEPTVQPTIIIPVDRDSLTLLYILMVSGILIIIVIFILLRKKKNSH